MQRCSRCSMSLSVSPHRPLLPAQLHIPILLGALYIPPLFLQPEEKQKASAAFAKLQAAMGVLGITAEEQAAVWRVLAGIHHLGAAGACRGKGCSLLPP